ncbi:MAG: sigma-70 family RNA polymerase sigma factor [Alistipes sp.]|nr:sigma-70 family RNA polymerase sigma factor [Alistipes sp.]
MKSTILSDKLLLEMYQQGNREAISQLLERHTRRVRDYIRMLVKDNDVAEDLTQEVLIKVVKVIDEGRYVDKGRFLPWLLRIAHNRVLDYFRAQKQVRSVSESSAGFDILGSKNFAEPSIEDQIISEQCAEEIRALVEELPEEQREVVRMRYYEGLSFKEIAELTGVSINTALGRMRYALINMRQIIKKKNLVLC